MKLTIYGASDDLLEVESDDGSIRDEFNVPGYLDVLVESPDGASVVIYAEFGAGEKRSAEWTLAIRNTDQWPLDWNIQFGERPDREDDPAIILDVPDGTTVRAL